MAAGKEHRETCERLLSTEWEARAAEHRKFNSTHALGAEKSVIKPRLESDGKGYAIYLICLFLHPLLTSLFLLDGLKAKYLNKLNGAIKAEFLKIISSSADGDRVV